MLHFKNGKFVAETSEGVKFEDPEIISIDIELNEDQRRKISMGYEIKFEDPEIILFETNESKLNEYKKNRSENYPSIEEYIDAQVKKASSDPEVQAAGIAQEEKYLADCLAVKKMFPKPLTI